MSVMRIKRRKRTFNFGEFVLGVQIASMFLIALETFCWKTDLLCERKNNITKFTVSLLSSINS